MVDTVGELLASACRRYGPRVAVRKGAEQRTYAELLERGARLANALAAHCVEPGQHVAALLEDRPASLEVYVACALGGYPVVHVNDRLVAREVDHVLQDSGAAALVHTDGRTGVVAELSSAGDLRAVVTIGDERPPGALGYDDLLAAASTSVPAVRRGPEDLAILGYTSGTTGFPKGAMISHRALVNCIRTIPYAYRLPMYGRCAFTGTLSFVSGIWGVILPHLYLGGTLDFCAGMPLDQLVDHMVAHGSTFTYAPSPLVPAFVEAVRARPEVLRTLLSVLHSASPLPPAHMEMLIDAVGDRVVEVWGMTESAGALTATTRTDYLGRCEADDLLSTVGRPLANAAVEVRGEDGEALGPGETGELVVSADTMFSGYWGQPEQTAEVFDGTWYRTGDVGHVDEAGYVYVTDRVKDLIISGGMNVYPAEVEAALVELDGVAEVAVVGLPDERFGEAVTAAVVRVPGSDLTEEQVIAAARGRLASYKKPRRVVFVDSLPRNVGMKVQRHALREQLLAQEAGR